MATQEYEFHPYAAALPLLNKPRLIELAENIKTEGQKYPIILYEGRILDGRNRYRACVLAGVEPRFEVLNGDSNPAAFIRSLNTMRRDSTKSQRVISLRKLAKFEGEWLAERAAAAAFAAEEVPDDEPVAGDPAPAAPLPTSQTVEESAVQAGVGITTAKDADTLIREADPALVAQVESGEKSVDAAIREHRAVKRAAVVALDKVGYVIPEAILAQWRWAEEWGKELLSQVGEARNRLQEAMEAGDPVVIEITNSTLADLNNAYHSLKLTIPYAVCTSCQGQVRDKCNLCKGRGFFSEFAWGHYVPKETKRLRERMAQK